MEEKEKRAATRIEALFEGVLIFEAEGQGIQAIEVVTKDVSVDGAYLWADAPKACPRYCLPLGQLCESISPKRRDMDLQSSSIKCSIRNLAKDALPRYFGIPLALLQSVSNSTPHFSASESHTRLLFPVAFLASSHSLCWSSDSWAGVEQEKPFANVNVMVSLHGVRNETRGDDAHPETPKNPASQNLAMPRQVRRRTYHLAGSFLNHLCSRLGRQQHQC
jgi:hypothetical protein